MPKAGAMLIPLLPTFVLALQPSTLSPVLGPTATLLSARTAGIGMGTQLSQDLEKDRPNRRTVFMHKEWVNHRDSDRTWKNMKTLYDSSVFKAVSKEVTLITSMAVFVVGYQDFGGVYHESDLILPAGTYHPRASIPAQP